MVFIISLLKIILVITVIMSCLNFADSEQTYVDKACDGPAIRKPVLDYNQTFTVDPSLTGAQ